MLVKGELRISIWGLGGQDEFHAFHDLVVPNLNDNGELVLSFYCAKSYAMKTPIMKSISHWHEGTEAKSLVSR